MSSVITEVSVAQNAILSLIEHLKHDIVVTLCKYYVTLHFLINNPKPCKYIIEHNPTHSKQFILVSF